jgi:GH25 family lysozyme M1 (1,4-beta-N-acetylmuramidase)
MIPVLSWQISPAWPLRGIDVSSHQSPGQISVSGLDFVIARSSYGARPDTTARAWANAARDAGIKRFSLYHFARHGTQEHQSPRRQIMAARETIEAVRERWTGPLAIYLDAEDNSKFDGHFVRDNALEMYAEIIAGLKTIPDLTVGLYTAPGWFEALNAPPDFHALPTWLAHYGSRNRTRPAIRRFQRCGIWQFGLTPWSGQHVDGNVATAWPETQAVPFTEPSPTDPPSAPAAPATPAARPTMEELLTRAAEELTTAQEHTRAAWSLLSDARRALK